MYSNSAKYALNAIIFLAVNSSENKKVMVKDIVNSIDVPKAYLAKILQKLSKDGYISSTKGPKGGFFLDDENMKQSLLSIIYAIDGQEKWNSCLMSLENCNEDKPCPLHEMAKPTRQKLINSFGKKSIGDLAKEVKNGKSFFPFIISKKS